MRMWMLPGECLCNKHLGGEYSEIFKHRHNFVKHHKIDGRIFPVVQIEPSSMANRVEELRKEAHKRHLNYNAVYEIPDISYLPENIRNAKVDLEISKKDLGERCPDCKKRIEKYYSPIGEVGDIISWKFDDTDNVPEYLKNTEWSADIAMVDEKERHYGVYATYGQDLIDFDKCTLRKIIK